VCVCARARASVPADVVMMVCLYVCACMCVHEAHEMSRGGDGGLRTQRDVEIGCRDENVFCLQGRYSHQLMLLALWLAVLWRKLTFKTLSQIACGDASSLEYSI
jgi:hypothetical protein